MEMFVRLIGIICMVLPFGAFADNGDGEREALARLLHEFNALMPLIDEAETKSDTSSRIKFNYEWLRKDLAMIRHGVQEHISKPRAEPREFVPLKGDYRR